MAEVRVDITGDRSGLKRELSNAEKDLKNFSGKAASSTRTFANSLNAGAAAAKKLGLAFAGGLGIAAASAGLKSFGAIATQVLANARKEAELTQKAFTNAFSSTVGFNIPQDTFTITTRDQAVEAGRFAREELNRVTQDLERNFSGLINADAFSGLLSGALELSSIAGVGQDEKFRLRLLLEQRQQLQGQVDQYRQIEQSLVFQAKLADRFRKQGISSDAENEALSPAPVNGITPLFPGNPSGFDLGALPDGSDRVFQETFDSSIVTDILSIQNAVDAGVIPALQGMRQEAGLLQQQLLFMLDAGVKPSNEAFQQTFTQLQGVEGELKNMTEGVNAGAVALGLIGQVGASALTGLLIKFEEANSAAAKLRNSLRSVLSSFIQIGLKAGITLGIGALTGNPLSFGAALGSAVGIATGGTTGAAAAGRGDSLSLSGASAALGASGNTLALETEIRGDAIAVVLRESQAARIGRGGAI